MNGHQISPCFKKNTEHHAKQLFTSQQTISTLTKYEASSTYDRMFHVEEGYSSKLKRDDLQHTQGLNVNAEEVGKTVVCVLGQGVMINRLMSVYGRAFLLRGESTKHLE